jgi:hypothetical protein
MSNSLFSRLASYSQNPNKKSTENFTTEVMAYLINEDAAFRRLFLRLLISDRRMLRGFSQARAQPQQSFVRGIVDLVVSGRRSRILVEVKIAAAETLTKIRGKGLVPQVKKYLGYREGPVAYLTTRTVPSPQVKSARFLGHFFFDDLHRELLQARLTKPGRLFLDFMEENGMESEAPFTKADVRGAQHAFRFAKKCVTAIDEIISGVEQKFKKLFHTRANFTKGYFHPSYGYAYAYTRNFSWRGHRQIYISIFIMPDAGELAYGVSAQVTRSDMKRLNQVLKWDEEDGELYTWHPISSGVDSRDIIPSVLIDLKKLRTGLNRAV